MTRIAMALALLLAACGGDKGSGGDDKGGETKKDEKKDEKKDKKDKKDEGSAKADAGSGSGSAAPDKKDLPTATDFEDDAIGKITEKNLETEVTTLEKEVGD